MDQLDSIKNNIFNNTFKEYRHKEDADLLLLYDNKFESVGTRCCIVDKERNEILAMQTNLVYNDNSRLKTLDWGSVVTEECVDGTTLVVFYHKDKLYITTRKCLDAGTSRWNSQSHKDMFLESIEGKLDLNTLSRDRVYYFVLVHHLDKKVVDYTNKYGKDYKEAVHIMTCEKYTYKTVDEVLPNVHCVKQLNIKSSKELFEHLKMTEHKIQTQAQLSDFGVIIKLVKDGIVTSILRFEAFTYQDLFGCKPNVRNRFQTFFELYRRNELTKFLKFQAQEDKDQSKFIHTAMQELTTETLNLYLKTRNKGLPDTYSKMKGNYKTVLFQLHGIFLEKRNKQVTAKLTFLDVYSYLKNYLTLELFISLITERRDLIKANPGLGGFVVSENVNNFVQQLLNE